MRKALTAFGGFCDLFTFLLEGVGHALKAI
jgi:hypothetical protein